jgi:hypothetical protein
MFNQPSIAILIDCWYQGNSPPNSILFSNILKFIENPNIKTVILASYTRAEHIDSNALWYENYNDFFYKKQTHNRIRNLFTSHKIYQTTHSVMTTDPRILYYTNNNKFQIAMNWYWEIEHYLVIHSEIKNIYVFGTAWENCVRTRPLGYEELKRKFQNINIFTDPTCTLNMIGRQPNLNKYHNWQHIENNIWKYDP